MDDPISSRIGQDKYYTDGIVIAVTDSPLITQYIPREQKIIGCIYAVDIVMNEGTFLFCTGWNESHIILFISLQGALSNLGWKLGLSSDRVRDSQPV